MATQMEAAARRHKTGWAAGVLLAALLVGGSAGAYTGGRVADVEVYDRQDGTPLVVYEKDGRRYVVGTPGHEYALRVRNLTGARILAVTSVDGVNVVTGETAAPDQSGYVVDAWGSVEIAGWRKSLQNTAAFYFTDLGDSYAARTGRPGNVGVIGVAVFRERERPIAYKPPLRDKIARADPPASAPAAAEPFGASNQAQPSSPPMQAREESRLQKDAELADGAAKRAASPLGTGHGRSESSYATQVAFDRGSTSPSEVLSISYDRRETLAAMGVIPRPYYARRAPQPFPGAVTFVPDPR